jgi:hypothetical protein
MQELLAFLLRKGTGKAGLRQVDQFIERQDIKTDAAILAGCDQVFSIWAEGYIIRLSILPTDGPENRLPLPCCT